MKVWRYGFIGGPERVVYVIVATDERQQPILEECWKPPREGYIKLIFSGAAVGNPGGTGCRGLL